MSSAEGAKWISRTSDCEEPSARLRSIDAAGVMPLPAVSSRIGPAGSSPQQNVPTGPDALTFTPGRMVSWSQFDTCPPCTRFTVIETLPPTSAEDEIE